MDNEIRQIKSLKDVESSKELLYTEYEKEAKKVMEKYSLSDNDILEIEKSFKWGMAVHGTIAEIAHVIKRDGLRPPPDIKVIYANVPPRYDGQVSEIECFGVLIECIKQSTIWAVDKMIQKCSSSRRALLDFPELSPAMVLLKGNEDLCFDCNLDIESPPCGYTGGFIVQTLGVDYIETIAILSKSEVKDIYHQLENIADNWFWNAFEKVTADKLVAKIVEYLIKKYVRRS